MSSSSSSSPDPPPAHPTPSSPRDHNSLLPNSSRRVSFRRSISAHAHLHRARRAACRPAGRRHRFPLAPVRARSVVKGGGQSMQGVAGATAVDSPGGGAEAAPRPSRYESQKRRDWHTFGQYLRNHRPPLELARCSGAHVLEFLRYLDQFGKTKVHAAGCPFFGHPSPPAPCPCPLRQAWGSLDALVGRLRAAFEEHGGRPEANPFGARAVRLYLREVRDSQAKARGIAYEKKRRKRPPPSSASQKAAKAAPSPQQPASMHAAAAAPDRKPEVIVARAVPAQGHYFIPHPQHFMHGHFLMPGAGHEDAAAASSSSGNSNSNGHSGGAVDEMALAMAAAEAHAAGCMLPLSVFN